MCLGIPGKVVEVLDGYAGRLTLVDVERAAQDQHRHARRRRPGCSSTWVFALETVDEVAAAEAMRGLEMMGRERDG